MMKTAIIDAVFASDSSNNIIVYDLRRGTVLTHYKSGAINTQCLSVLKNDYVVAAEKGPLIYAWPMNSQEKLQNVRMLCPGVVGCCTVSPDALYIAVSIGEKLLIWQLSSGKLLCTSSSHYQSITVIRWSPNSSDIATGGEDGLVCVWKLCHMVSTNYMYLGIKSNEAAVSQTTARYTFSHHSIRITDLYIGYGGLRARLFTASADNTCRVYDLASGNQLLCVIFDIRPTCIIANAPETKVFVGTFNGNIKTFSLLDPPRNLEYHPKDSDFISILTGHTKAVMCLRFSVDDTILVSGSADETIRLWHISSDQCIRIIRMRGPVTNLVVRTVPESLQSFELHPTTMIKSFQKRYDDNPDALTLDIACPVDRYSTSVISQVGEDENVSALKQKVEELQRINRELFSFAKTKILERKHKTATENIKIKPNKNGIPDQAKSKSSNKKKKMKKHSNKS